MQKRNKADRDGLYKRKDSDYWWASFTNARGRRTRRSTGTASKKEAEALLAKWKLESYRNQHWDEQPDRTFDELMLLYIRATEKQKRAPTRDISSLKHLYPVFSGRQLSEISTVDLRRYIAQRRMDGAAASTINKEVGLVSTAYNFARREWGWNFQNPAVDCRQREPEGWVRWLTRAQAVALIRSANQVPKAAHLPDLIQLALHTGMRRGELLGLEWHRVDLDRDLIYLEAIHTKTARRRSIPLNRDAKAAIISRLQVRAAHCPASPWVFAHKTGQRIGDVKHSFTRACEWAGIEDFRFHDLRHCFAAWAVSAGVPLVEVRDLLGHKTIEMTERYAHLAPDNLRSAVKQLEGSTSRFGHVGDSGEVVEFGKSLI